MPISASGYFNSLKSYLNMEYYAIQPNLDNELKLKEKIFATEGEKIIEIKFNDVGEVFAIKLDKEYQKGKSHPLFHFLDNEGKPWARRCDFIIFRLNRNIKVYCIEFKFKTLPVDSIIDQLDASQAWCQSLHSTIKNYTNTQHRLNLTKYVLSYHPGPNDFLDRGNKYLRKDPTIRHYHYDEVNNTQIENLENTSVIQIG